MKLHTAINVMYRSLVAYIEDSVGKDTDEAREIDEAYALVNSKVNLDTHDVGMISSVMSYEMFDKIHKKSSFGVMRTHDQISEWALEFHKKYDDEISDWANEDQLKEVGFEKSQCWDEAIVEFIDNKLNGGRE